MPARDAFEYAIIRIVPRVERGEFINAGVVLFCRSRRFLEAHVDLDAARLSALAPGLDLGAVADQLDAIVTVCQGGSAAGPLGLLPQHERFRWLTAPRSTIVQPSPVHCGIADDPRAALDDLMSRMVRAAVISHEP